MIPSSGVLTQKKLDPVGWGIPSPGGGLDKPTDRDQRSWVFLNDPKNTLPLTDRENPKKYFPEKQNTNKTLFISQKSSMI